MKITGVRLLLVTFAYTLAYFLGVYFGIFFALLFPTSITGSLPDLVANWLIGAPAALVLFTVFFLVSTGGKYKNWWIVISIIPAVWFYLMFDPLHIYFPIILGLIAWGLGTFAHKTLTNLAPSFMSKLGQR